MGKKIFVSYKHEDNNVKPLPGLYTTTARDYVEELIDLFKEDREIYKGEGNEDISDFKDETIKTKLKEKIHDSSVTLVLVSQGMKKALTKETDQWMPWEISYSLKEIERNDKTSHTNAVICVVLPDNLGGYGYYINHYDCSQYKNVPYLDTPFLFKILSKNMFNQKNPNRCSDTCSCNGSVYRGEHSYILSVTWEDFINDKDTYLDRAIDIMNDRKQYNLTKEIPDDAWS